MSEREFQDQVVRLAKLLGWKVAHFRQGRTARGWRTPMTGDVGWPDLVLARNGTVLFRELKVNARPTEAQRDWLTALAAGGLDAAVWTADDWPEIERVLTAPNVREKGT